MSRSDDLHYMHPHRNDHEPRARRRAFGIGVALLFTVAACGGSDEQGDGDEVLSGIVREPAPQVDLVALPSLSEPGTEVDFRADPGNVQVVYFGFTNCPDVCPTTMADLAVALRLLGPELADRVEVVMAGVDPDRDLDVLDGYVTTFVPDGVAVGTPDEDLLESAGEPFGATWEVRTLDDGTIEVDHSPFLYAVDDEGKLAVSWQFGTSAQDLAKDLRLLLEQASA